MKSKPKKTDNTEQLYLDLLKEARKDKKKLDRIKDAAIKCHHYQLAQVLRDEERVLFPETKAQLEAEELDQKLNCLFRMVGMEPPLGYSWLAYHVSIAFKSKKGNFKMSDAADLISKMEKYFKR